jgi:hypothetical protein
LLIKILERGRRNLNHAGVAAKHSNEENEMTAVFETPRFRVHITHKTAWIENREAADWVFRTQHSIPVSAESIADGAQLSTLKEAMLDFEAVRPGDTSLRAALTGIQAPKPAPTAAAVQARPSRFINRPSVPRKLHQWRSPLRPPLKPALNGA